LSLPATVEYSRSRNSDGRGWRSSFAIPDLLAVERPGDTVAFIRPAHVQARIQRRVSSGQNDQRETSASAPSRAVRQARTLPPPASAAAAILFIVARAAARPRPKLKGNLQGHLHQPRRCGLDHLAKGPRTEVAIDSHGAEELRVIEGVESLQPELQVLP